MKIRNNVKVWAALLVGSLFQPMTASAYNEDTYWDILVDGIGYWFNEDGNTVSICANSRTGSDYSGSFHVPESITYDGKQYTVTEVGEYAFAECGELLQVILPGTITKIGARAFNECSELRSVLIPTNVSTIGNYAFNRCSKLFMLCCQPILPPEFEGNYVFSGVEKSSVIIFGPMHFYEEYQRVSQWAGFGAYQPLSYDICSDGLYYSLESYTANAKISECFDGSQNYTGDIVAPAELELFKGTHNSLTVKVDEVLEGAFKNSTITSVKLPETVKTIGKEAFSGCKNLKECHLMGAEYVNEKAFYDTGLEQVWLEYEEMLGIKSEAFAKSGDISVIVCRSYYSIPALAENAFEESVYANASLQVREEVLSRYKAATGWEKFAHIGGFSGVESIESESYAPVEYFNLQGVKVANPGNGIFIRRQGGKATKIIK